MADLKLKSCKEISIDLSKITVKEWQALRNPAYSNDVDNEVVSRITGLTIEAIEKMAADEFNAMIFGIFDKMKRPLDSPN